MKLARIAVNGEPRVIVRGQRDAIAIVGGQPFADLPELLAACDGDASRISPGEPVTVREESLLSVVGRPRKVLCIGLNYRDHLDESDRITSRETPSNRPAAPIIFPKWDTSLTGPYADIPLPPESSQVDWESEMAFVFSKRCRRVKAADAASVVFGYTASNDVSMRDFQMATSQWGPGKAWDRSTPLGPVLVTADELGGASPDLSLRGLLNGEVMQETRTTYLLFDVGQLVEFITTFLTVEPGDVCITGTCSGVGAARKPPIFLKNGDVFEVEIEGIGTVRNRFVTEKAS